MVFGTRMRRLRTREHSSHLHACVSNSLTVHSHKSAVTELLTLQWRYQISPSRLKHLDTRGIRAFYPSGRARAWILIESHIRVSQLQAQT